MFLRMLDQQLGVSDSMAQRKMWREAYTSLQSLARRGLAEVPLDDAAAGASDAVVEQLREVNRHLGEIRDKLGGLGR
jgi:hypothetical protein